MSRASRNWRTPAGELGLTVVALLVYFLIRGSHPDNVPASLNRTFALIRFEQRLGIFHESTFQALFLHHSWLIDFANIVYVWGMYPVMLAVAIWLAFTDLGRFRYVRNIMLVSACFGIAGYWLFPAAPPRLMGGYGFVDTLHLASSNVKDLQPGPFVNAYAALPSFHFAWVALVCVAAWFNTRNWVIRSLAVAVTLLMFWAIVVTANHLFVDLVLGVAVVLLSWLVLLAATWASRVLAHLTAQATGRQRAHLH